MSFQLVYYSQQDPQWKNDILGLGDPGDTIGYVGCALTSITMLLNGYGYSETPQTFNEKLKNAGGFISAMIRWEYISKVYPQISLKSNVTCETTDAPLSQIDAAIAAGHPVVVRVDSSPAPGLQWHYVLLYAREGNDYLMLDPYPYKPGTTSKDYLMARYSQGNPLQRAIQQVLFYEATGSGGPIETPSGGSATTPPAPAPAPSTPPPPPVPTGAPGIGIYVQPTSDVIAFLNMRFSADTTSTANVIAQILPGTKMELLRSGDENKVGVNGQFVYAREPQGQEGYVAAWYVERVSTAPTTTPPATTPPAPAPGPATPPSPAPSTPPAPAQEMKVKVTASIGARVYTYASPRTPLISVEPLGAVLTVLEDANQAKAKVGVNGKWITVSASNGKRGFVQAQFVALA